MGNTWRWSWVVTLATLIACGSDPPAPDGTLNYEATRMVITGAIDADALAEGAMLSLTMREGGFVTGALFLPAAVTGAGDVNANMAGSWVVRDDTVEFNQVDRSFVSEVRWELSFETLTALDSADGSFYDVVLTRIFP